MNNLLENSLVIFVLLLCGCKLEYDPKADRERFAKQRQMANRELPSLSEQGELPKKESESQVVAVNPIDQKYETLCSSCHGLDGKANTPAGKALNPQSRNFTDVAWQDSRTNEQIANVIKNGGAPYGLSAAMAPWGALLSDKEIEQMVSKVRSYKGK